MRTLRSIALAGVLLGCAGTAAATPIAISTFDTGDEGWTVGHFFSTFSEPPPPTFVGSGGNPGGFIRTDDRFDWTSFHAPAEFLGNKLGAYGASLSFDERVASSDLNAVYPMVVISNTGYALELQFRTSAPASGSTGPWTHFLIPLVASAGWEICDAGCQAGSGLAGLAATEEQLQAVLSDLLFLHVDADWLTGPNDLTDLDNVIMTPEPSSWLLLGGGLVLAYRLRRR